jgi:hypothetical protein
MERVMGIEPTTSAWKAEVLPLNYTRESIDFFILHNSKIEVKFFWGILSNYALSLGLF